MLCWGGVWDGCSQGVTTTPQTQHEFSLGVTMSIWTDLFKQNEIVSPNNNAQLTLDQSPNISKHQPFHRSIMTPHMWSTPTSQSPRRRRSVAESATVFRIRDEDLLSHWLMRECHWPEMEIDEHCVESHERCSWCCHTAWTCWQAAYLSQGVTGWKELKSVTQKR